MTDITLQDGRVLSVETDDPERAKQAAINFLRREREAGNAPAYDDKWPDANPAEGMSNVELGLAGAGKSVVDIGRGLKQIGMEAGNLAGVVDDEAVTDYREHIDQINKQDAPLMETGAGLTGNVAGTLATTMIPAGIAANATKAVNLPRTAAALSKFVNPTTAVSATATGGVHGAIQPVGTDQSRLENTGVGAATGLASNAALKVGARAAEPVKQNLSKAGRAAADLLRKNGIDLDLAQQTGSKLATRVSSYLDDSPATVGAQQEFRDGQQRQFNRAVLKLIGENADAATPDVLGRANTRIGKVFDDFAEANPLNYDNVLRKQMAALLRRAERELEPGQVVPIKKMVNHINERGMADGAILGRTYQNARSSLGRMSKGGEKGYFARQLREVLDDSLERTVKSQGDDAGLTAIRNARRDYRRYLQIEDGVGLNESGDIVPTTLYNRVASKGNRAQTLRGRGDQELVKLARAGKMLLKNKTPNSGTTARIAGQLAPSVAAGGMGYAAGGDLESAAKLAAGVYVAPRAIQYAMNNPGISSMLANGMDDGLLRHILQMPQTSSTVGGVLRHAPAAAVVGTPKK